MKTFKLFSISLIASAIFLILFDLLMLSVNKPMNKSLFDVLIIQIPIALIIPLNLLINDRIVEREYIIKDFSYEKFNFLLKKHNAKLIAELDNETEYKLSIFYSFNGIVNVQINKESLRINAPIRFIRELQRR